MGENKCMYEIKTSEQFNRCVATVSEDTQAAQAAALANGITLTDDIAYSSLLDDSWFSNFLSDVYNNMGLVFGFGIGVATAVSFGYLYVMRIPGLLFVTIWGIILSIQVLLVVGSFLLWDLASTWSTDGIHSKNEWYIMKILSYIGMGKRDSLCFAPFCSCTNFTITRCFISIFLRNYCVTKPSAASYWRDQGGSKGPGVYPHVDRVARHPSRWNNGIFSSLDYLRVILGIVG